ncbi:MAG: TraR/DksA C4-type zinc finger protein [Chloroflexota bacterium]|nr:TraR/DksA C4-type zinc finger protein [Chloroflexota bacterium]
MAGPARTPAEIDVEQYRPRLVEMKGQLEADLAAYRRDEVDQDGGKDEPGSGQHWEHSGYGDHPADGATELFEREKNITLEQTLRDHLQLVEHALARVEEGTYGTCERCGRPIGAERLDAIPETTLCLEHKAEAERGGSGGVATTNAWRAES